VANTTSDAKAKRHPRNPHTLAGVAKILLRQRFGFMAVLLRFVRAPNEIAQLAVGRISESVQFSGTDLEIRPTNAINLV
jgi:hypothetical protein